MFFLVTDMINFVVLFGFFSFMLRSDMMLVRRACKKVDGEKLSEEEKFNKYGFRNR